MNGTSDVSLGQPALLYGRYKMGLDFSLPILQMNIVFVHKIPERKDSLLTIFSPFKGRVWIGVGISFLAVVAFLLLDAFIYDRQSLNRKNR